MKTWCWLLMFFSCKNLVYCKNFGKIDSTREKMFLVLPFYTFATIFNYQITFFNIKSNSERYRMHEISSITRLLIALCSSLSPVMEVGDYFKSNLKSWCQQQTLSNLEKLIICIIKNRLKFLAEMASKHEESCKKHQHSVKEILEGHSLKATL